VRAAPGQQPLRDADDQLVADGVPQRVVDVLEVVQVDEEDGYDALGGDLGLQLRQERLAVGETGQDVAADPLGQCRRQLAPLDLRRDGMRSLPAEQQRRPPFGAAQPGEVPDRQDGDTRDIDGTRKPAGDERETDAVDENDNRSGHGRTAARCLRPMLLPRDRFLAHRVASFCWGPEARRGLVCCSVEC
jgi:hypothetical protein